MNVDIAPTILDIAGITVPRHMDGRSLVQLVQRYGNVCCSLTMLSLIGISS